jgi:hypothetical protein
LLSRGRRKHRKKIQEENMKMKVHLTEIIHGEKIKAEVGRLKMKKN